jgi:hypothetical protein
MTLAGEGRAGRRPAGVTHVPMASLRGWLVFLWQSSLQSSFVHFPTSKKGPHDRCRRRLSELDHMMRIEEIPHVAAFYLQPTR